MQTCLQADAQILPPSIRSVPSTSSGCACQIQFAGSSLTFISLVLQTGGCRSRWAASTVCSTSLTKRSSWPGGAGRLTGRFSHFCRDRTLCFNFCFILFRDLKREERLIRRQVHHSHTVHFTLCPLSTALHYLSLIAKFHLHHTSGNRKHSCILATSSHNH